MCTHKHTLGSNSTLLVATFGQSIAELIAFAALSTGIIFLSFLICYSFLKDEKHGKYVTYYQPSKHTSLESWSQEDLVHETKNCVTRWVLLMLHTYIWRTEDLETQYSTYMIGSPICHIRLRITHLYHIRNIVKMCILLCRWNKLLIAKPSCNSYCRIRTRWWCENFISLYMLYILYILFIVFTKCSHQRITLNFMVGLGVKTLWLLLQLGWY